MAALGFRSPVLRPTHDEAASHGVATNLAEPAWYGTNTGTSTQDQHQHPHQQQRQERQRQRSEQLASCPRRLHAAAETHRGDRAATRRDAYNTYMPPRRLGWTLVGTWEKGSATLATQQWPGADEISTDGHLPEPRRLACLPVVPSTAEPVLAEAFRGHVVRRGVSARSRTPGTRPSPSRCPVRPWLRFSGWPGGAAGAIHDVDVDNDDAEPVEAGAAAWTVLYFSNMIALVQDAARRGRQRGPGFRLAPLSCRLTGHRPGAHDSGNRAGIGQTERASAAMSCGPRANSDVDWAKANPSFQLLLHASARDWSRPLAVGLLAGRDTACMDGCALYGCCCKCATPPGAPDPPRPRLACDKQKSRGGWLAVHVGSLGMAGCVGQCRSEGDTGSPREHGAVRRDTAAGLMRHGGTSRNDRGRSGVASFRLSRIDDDVSTTTPKPRSWLDSTKRTEEGQTEWNGLVRSTGQPGGGRNGLDEAGWDGVPRRALTGCEATLQCEETLGMPISDLEHINNHLGDEGGGDPSQDARMSRPPFSTAAVSAGASEEPVLKRDEERGRDED
ncbi:hypothetical protein PCL_01684 [Purpureocillium lilacinum]|uniref:Uncharacterized protein n=1 Tax=Purpureocillium lilacinum TaxID=33203 RepID=A0A2U3E261_PURLI|nr:hypothetical protein PCL_01684 [Purpureocillium lilacinum]